MDDRAQTPPPPSATAASPGEALGTPDPVTPPVGGTVSAPPDRRNRRFNLRGRSLREHTARGTLINSAFQIGLSGLGFVRGFILAAFLTREDYGVWGVLVISLGTLLWLRQLGVGDKYIQQDEEDQELAFQKAFTMELGLTVVSVVVLAALLPFVVLVYGESELLLPGFVILATLPAAVLRTPLWVFYRQMEFLKQRLIESVDPIVGFVVAIALAVAGAGYWALIFGVLAGGWASAAVTLWQSPFKLRLRYDRGTLRSYAGFSWPLFAAAGGGVVIAQVSVLATEAQLGLAGAGAIALAATISQFTDRVDMVITGTMYPAICAVKDRTELLFESFVKSNRMALMWAVPFGFGLTLFCSDLVTFGIGEEWRPAVIVLQVYGATAAIAHVGFNWDAYFRAIDRTRPLAFAATAAAGSFLLVVFPLLSAHGLRGFAVAIAIQAFVHLCCRAYFLAKLFEGFDFLRHATRAIAPAVPAVAAVLLLRLVEPVERTFAVALGEFAIYCAITVAATIALEGKLLREALGYLRARPAADTPA